MWDHIRPEHLTKNYGLAGGFLDARKHIDAAKPSLPASDSSELVKKRFRAHLEATVRRGAPEAN